MIKIFKCALFLHINISLTFNLKPDLFICSIKALSINGFQVLSSLVINNKINIKCKIAVPMFNAEKN